MARTTRLKPLTPHKDITTEFKSLILTHAPSVPDIAIAGLIHSLPDLEVINLKGCTLAGKKTVETIVKQCGKLRRVNLKGTNVSEGDVRLLLHKFALQLEGFKVDKVRFSVSRHAQLPVTEQS